MKNEKFFADSVLHVVASENIDISADLESTSNQSISELLNEEKEEDQKTSE